jgi:hypothetical protein
MSPWGSDHIFMDKSMFGVWPLRILEVAPQPFLLIIRTGHIVTIEIDE